MPKRTWCAAGLGALLLALGACASASAPATPRPTPATPAPGEWLDFLNAYREAAGLSPVAENTALSDGDRRHAAYLVKNDAIQHSEDPRNRWYSRAGQAAARQSNLAVSYSSDQTDRWAIDSWMATPFHALGVLDPRLTQVGFGSYREAGRGLQMGAALNVLAGIGPTAAAAYPVFWPGNGATVPLSACRGEQPDPLTSCPGYTAPSGLPLLLQVGPGTLTPVVSATSFTQAGQPLDHCVFDESTYRNPDRAQQQIGRSILAARDAIVLLPRRPLTTGATYTASITVDGRTHTWSFTVDGAARVAGGSN